MNMRPMRPPHLTPRSPSDLPYLGPLSQQALTQAGITSISQLRELGSVAAYLQVQCSGALVSLTLLWRLEAIITGLPWQVVAKQHRRRLLQELAQHERNTPPATA